jgi:hypothetical protein
MSGAGGIVWSGLNLLMAFGLVIGMVLLWWVGIRVFVWFSLMLASFVPWIGRRHRHDRWDELNNGKR